MEGYIEEYKGYSIRPHVNNPKCYIISFRGQGGKIPQILDGMFTDRGTCRRNIDHYLEQKGNAKTSTKS